MAKVVLLCFLLAAAVTDILKKKLPVCFLSAGVVPVSVGIFGGIYGTSGDETQRVLLSAGIGILIGASFLLVSAVTGEKLGKADAILFCICGGATGYERLLTTIMSAFLLGALYAAAMLAMGRLNRKSSFAFAPFIFLGCIMAEVLMHEM